MRKRHVRIVVRENDGEMNYLMYLGAIAEPLPLTEENLADAFLGIAEFAPAGTPRIHQYVSREALGSISILVSDDRRGRRYRLQWCADTAKTTGDINEGLIVLRDMIEEMTRTGRYGAPVADQVSKETRVSRLSLYRSRALAGVGIFPNQEEERSLVGF